MNRDEVESLLPFLANGTLEGDEHDAVMSAVAADPELSNELDALRSIRDQMQSEDAFSPGKMGLARLMRAIEKEAPVVPPRRLDVRQPLVWQVAASVLLALLIGQAVVMNGNSDVTGYELAGEAALSIAFTETATEVQIRSILLEAGVEIVSGPSALGFYELRPIEGVTENEARAVLNASDIIEIRPDPVE
jgi:hypothetical protein